MKTTTEDTTTETTTINQRLLSVFEAMMSDPDVKIPKAFIPVAQNLVGNFLKNADPENLRKIIIDLRDNLLPWVLGEKE
jgi:hypothetical protein